MRKSVRQEQLNYRCTCTVCIVRRVTAGQWWSHKLILSQKIKKESNLLSTARTMQWKGHRKVHLNLLMKMLPKILLEAWAEPFSSHYCSKKNQNCPKNCLPPKSLNCKAPWKNDCFGLHFTWPFWAPLLVMWLSLIWERQKWLMVEIIMNAHERTIPASEINWTKCEVTELLMIKSSTEAEMFQQNSIWVIQYDKLLL